jgi:DNA ligase-1
MAQFRDVAELAEEMAGTASRLKKRAAIAAAILAVHAQSPEDVGLFCLYLAGLPFAEADPRKLNAGGALLSKAVLAVSGASGEALTAAFRKHGDMGSAAFDLLMGSSGDPASQRRDVGHPISLGEVAEAFAGMASARTTAVRAGLVEGLLRRASALEAKYLLKLMLGDMRIGVKQSLVEEAIGVAATAAFKPTAEGPDAGHPVDVAAVRHAVMLEADLGGAALRAFEGTLGEARMRLFHPLGFMLASPVETPEEAIERFTAKPVKAPVVKKGRKRKGADAVMEEVMEADVEATMLGAEESEELLAGAVDATPQIHDMGHPDGSGVGVEAFLEDKYDGMRAQVHFGDGEQGGRVAIYSRNREEITESFPELCEAFARAGDADGALILDGEILGWDFAAGVALPFAVLGQRIGRKKVGDEIRRAVPVVFMAFDVMFADGELMLGKALRARRNRLEAAVEKLWDRARAPFVARERKAQGSLFDLRDPTHRDGTAMNGAPESLDGMEEGMARLMISPARLVESAEEIDRAYADARARANEGVMLKAAGSLYLPGRRGLAWVKLKRELATLDVVVTGCEFGQGRKAGTLSDYTFAVRGEEGELLNVGKAYSGVTDAEIAELTEFFKAHTLEDYGHFRTVEPLVVFEVAFNNVMRSDRHASGFALRFPRILRIRTDKPLREIDTVQRVEEVYQSQVDKPAEGVKDE